MVRKSAALKPLQVEEAKPEKPTTKAEQLELDVTRQEDKPSLAKRHNGSGSL